MRIALALLALFAVAAAKPVDWTKTVTRAPSGAYVLGNPKAKVRFVEYLSYSCPHCAHFTTESSAPLKRGFVAGGTTAVEIRNAARDRYDFTASVLARCGGPARFFGNTEALMAAQESLMAKAQAYEASAPANTQINEALKALARASGLIEVMAKRGFKPAQLDACLTDKAAQDIVLAMTNEAWQVSKIPYTPYFLVNGQPAASSEWAAIEPQLRAATAAR